MAQRQQGFSVQNLQRYNATYFWLKAHKMGTLAKNVITLTKASHNIFQVEIHATNMNPQKGIFTLKNQVSVIPPIYV